MNAKLFKTVSVLEQMQKSKNFRYINENSQAIKNKKKKKKETS